MKKKIIIIISVIVLLFVGLIIRARIANAPTKKIITFEKPENYKEVIDNSVEPNTIQQTKSNISTEETSEIIDTLLVKLGDISCSDEGCFLDTKTTENKDIENVSFEFKINPSYEVIVITTPTNIIKDNRISDAFVNKNAKLICTRQKTANPDFKSYLINKIIVE